MKRPEETSARHEEWTQGLAELAVFGANVQPGRLVALTSFVGLEDMTRRVARMAYERGAKYVDVLYFDQWLKRERLLGAAEATLDYVPPWLLERLRYHADEHAALIRIAGPHAPDALAGIDPACVGRDFLPFLPGLLQVVNEGTVTRCVLPVPSRPWAQAVYPDLDPDAAYERLWEVVAHICRLDEDDPKAAWTDRLDALGRTAARLSERRFDTIRLFSPGTDLTIGLLPSCRWDPVDVTTVDGVRHYPNIPTEEILTTPDPQRADGYATVTVPRDLYGSILHGIRFEFAGGRVVKIDAERGAEALHAAAAKDDGASRLGELALVDGQGRIGPLETVFYENLIDENAATHIALGAGYVHPVGDQADRERVNRSQIHIDFCIGSSELAVDGIASDGTVTPVLRGGVWQI